MLKGRKHDNWRLNRLGKPLPKEMHADMGDMSMISAYLDRKFLVIHGKFVPNSEPFVIRRYHVLLSNSKWEAKHCTVMKDLNNNDHYSNNKHDKRSVKITINPLNRKSQKKLLVLKFEDSHFEPVINSQIKALLGNSDLPECFSHNIFNEWKFWKKFYSPENMDKTHEFYKNIDQGPNSEAETVKITIEKIIKMMHSFNLSYVERELDNNSSKHYEEAKVYFKKKNYVQPKQVC